MQQRRWPKWLAVGAAFLVLGTIVAVAALREPLRRYVEQQVNASLTGYTVSIGALDLELFGLAVALERVTVVQNARPRPPMAVIPRWRTSVAWRALLSLALVADTEFTAPELYLTPEQGTHEASDRVPLPDRGWQDALEAVYPLTVDRLAIRDGRFTFFPSPDLPPVTLSRIRLVTTNIRNVRSQRGDLPSSLSAAAVLFDSGRIGVEGRADYLARPSPAADLAIAVSDLPLPPLEPYLHAHGVAIGRGTISATGRVAVDATDVDLRIDRLDATAPALVVALSDPAATRARADAAVVASQARAATLHVALGEARITRGRLELHPDPAWMTRSAPPGLTLADLPALRLDDLDVRVTDVGSTRRPGARPTRFSVSATVFERGRLRVRGDAELFATPGPAAEARFELRAVPLTLLAPIARHWALDVTAGTVAAAGSLRHAEGRTALTLREVAVDQPALAFVTRTGADEKRLERAARATTVPAERPAFALEVRAARVRNGTFGFRDETATPPYRLTFGDTDVTVNGFSNQSSRRRGRATLRARFMDSGVASGDATFAGGSRQADFDLRFGLEQVALVELNDLLRARAGFDVVSGRFSFFGELAVERGRVDGYVKPFFEDLDVYDRRQDAGEPIGQQLYEGLVGAGGMLLENRSTDRVATRADLSGPLERPDADAAEIALGLLKNAFWQALLPGLDRAGRAS